MMAVNKFARLLSAILVLVAILLSASCVTISTQQPGQGAQTPEESTQPSEQPASEEPPVGSTPPASQSQGIWTGKWESKEWGTMELTQTGGSVTGTYTWDEGRIDGTVNGNVLRGIWSESPSYAPPDDAGDFEFILSPDGNSFTGKWRYGSSGDWEGDWSGERIR
jgi:hypothetical protein